MDDAELENAKHRAERAKQLLEDPLLLEAFEKAEKALLLAVKMTKLPDESYRGVLALQALDLVKNSLLSFVENGKVLEHNFRSKRFGIF